MILITGQMTAAKEFATAILQKAGVRYPGNKKLEKEVGELLWVEGIDDAMGEAAVEAATVVTLPTTMAV